MDNPLRSPILKGLEEYQNKSKLRFHMPGHKGTLPEEFNALAENLYSFDVTELDDTDDLYYPVSFLAESLNDLKKDRKSKESFYLVNGSTVGILSSVMGLLDPGDKILIESGCHKSVHNAVKLGRLKKVVLEQPSHKKGFPLPASEEKIFEILEEDKDIKMVFLTRPNYYGYASDIEKLAAYCSERGIYTIIDEAHGSHFVYSSLFPKSAVESGCSISINSFHKTMPSFTQTAVLNIGSLNEEDIQRVRCMLLMLQTSSPSFLFIASLDLSFRYMQKYKEKFLSLKKMIDLFLRKLENNIHISAEMDSEKDFTRILLYPKGNVIDMLSYLEKNGIYAEMHDENTIVLISTILDEERDFNRLYNTIENYKRSPSISSPQNKIHDNIGLPFLECEGKELLEDIYIYPPGSLYLEKGTILEKKHLVELAKFRKQKIRLHKSVSKNDDLLYVNIDK